MARDARAIIKQYNPNAKILTPPIGAYLVSSSNPCYAAGKLDSLFLSATHNGVNGACLTSSPCTGISEILRLPKPRLE